MFVRMIACGVLAVAPLTGCMHTDLTVAAESSASAATASRVVVNGRALDDSQLTALRQTYGAIPEPGRWWYDPISGMYGAEGHGTAGVMGPGHHLGEVVEDASGGTSLVVINGRRLTLDEAAYVATLAGGQMRPGRYWLDGDSNWGMTGNSFPMGNLRRIAATHTESSGDNEWSTLLAMK